MKCLSIIFAAALLGCTEFAHGQGFINLDFEAANIPNGTAAGSVVSMNEAIPGWAAYIGNTPDNSIIYNAIALGDTSISILTTGGTPSPLDGSFSVDLFGGVTDTSASISQTGLVPGNTKSIQFIAQGAGVVSLNGQVIPIFAISTGPNYTLYGGDVSAFAGKTENLVFSEPEGINNYWEIDNIQFSSSIVPEPNELTLAALGTLPFLFFALRRWQKVRSI